MKILKMHTLVIFTSLVFVLCFFVFSVRSVNAAGEFITVWKTDNTGTSNDNQITIPTYSGLTYDYDVDWGDTNTDSNLTGDATHTYATAGTYTVTITGTFPAIHFNFGGDKEKILRVTQWGNIEWQTMGSAFFGCTNLEITASDSPDLSTVADMTYMFRSSGVTDEDFSGWDTGSVTTMIGVFQDTSFDGDISGWDTSNVTTMTGLFYGNTAFNSDISSWDTSSVTAINDMFTGATSFNINIGAWDVSNVTNFSSMFFNASSFNKNIGSWDTSSATSMAYMFNGATSFNQNIGSWDVSGVTNMDTMFGGASAFDQNLSAWNVSSLTNANGLFKDATIFSNASSAIPWDVSSVTSMNYMFANTSFNQNIGSWDVSSVTSMGSMFSGTTLSTANYDALLSGWSALSLQDNVTFDGGSSKYCSSVPDRASIITNHNWTITDGGVDTCYTLRYLSGDGGSLSGTLLQYIRSGSNGSSISAVPSGSYTFSQWSDGSTQNPRTDLAVASNISVNAIFNAPGMVRLSLVNPSALNGEKLDFSINNNSNSTSDRSVFIKMNADPVTTKGYAISLNPNFLNEGIYPYLGKEAHFTLPEIFGEYTIYLYYYSTSGIKSEIISHKITYTDSARSFKNNVDGKMFLRNLKLGSVGEDVKMLQIFLNAHGFNVSQAGPGAIGFETNYFGTKTEKALKSFQEFYSHDILAPLGLTKATGKFYSSTRSFVEKMFGI